MVYCKFYMIVHFFSVTASIFPFQLLLALSDSRLRPSVEPILFFLLLGFQHSESVFHSVVSHLPRSLRSLKKQDSSSALLTLGRLGESAHFLMRRFPNFPELYNPVEEALAEVQVGPPTEARSSGEFSRMQYPAFCGYVDRECVGMKRAS